jgi:hypothetical protein
LELGSSLKEVKAWWFGCSQIVSEKKTLQKKQWISIQNNSHISVWFFEQ